MEINLDSENAKVRTSEDDWLITGMEMIMEDLQTNCCSVLMRFPDSE